MSLPSTITVIVPVKDGARLLGEVLDGIDRQRIEADVETLVVDSGSRDGSPEIARAHGCRVIEIDPADFGHGTTRNMAAERSDSEALVFITQDATPVRDDWLATLVAPLDEPRRVGLSFGPHLPRPETSPMIARELEEFFGSFATTGAVRVDAVADTGDPASSFFSNVNAAVLASCWREVRFRDVAYAEDQAFARDAMAKGWRKAYVPRAGVLHAHDYPFGEFMRRYFDEYRGLRESVGHVQGFDLRRVTRDTARAVGADRAYMRDRGLTAGERALWTGRSMSHHAGRAIFSSLGSRHARLPRPLERRLSLERRATPPAGRSSELRAPSPDGLAYGYVRPYFCDPEAPLEIPSPHDGDKPGLHFAWLVPPFRRGSGGHMTIFTIVKELEDKGHSCSIWIHDPTGMMDRRVAVAHRELREGFLPLKAGMFRGFDDWQGADVAFATGWQTAYPLWTLGGCKLKSYLVQDHEPEFYGTSAERHWGAETYRMGYPAVAASPWLRDLLVESYGARAKTFELGVDLDVYRPMELERDDATVVFYARPATPRRATELGLLALDELIRRRPEVRVVLFGDVKPPSTSFPYEFGGVMDAHRLAHLYNRATAGLVISLTNYSRMPKEMMACGLPVVDVVHASVRSVFGGDNRVIELAEPSISSLADALERLLDDPDRRAHVASAARDFVAGMTWRAAADQVEDAVRDWLRERWVGRLDHVPATDGAMTPGAVMERILAGDRFPAGRHER